MQSTSQLRVSANSMILDLAHFSPLFCASANLSLKTGSYSFLSSSIVLFKDSFAWSYFCFLFHNGQAASSKMSRGPKVQCHSHLRGVEKLRKMVQSSRTEKLTTTRLLKLWHQEDADANYASNCKKNQQQNGKKSKLELKTRLFQTTSWQDIWPFECFLGSQ